MLLQRISLPLVFALLIGCHSNSGVDISSSAEESGSEDVTNTASTDPGPSEETAKVIGFSAMSLANPFFQIIADNLIAAAKENGFTRPDPNRSGSMMKFAVS